MNFDQLRLHKILKIFLCLKKLNVSAYSTACSHTFVEHMNLYLYLYLFFIDMHCDVKFVYVYAFIILRSTCVDCMGKVVVLFTGNQITDQK